jgi:hypothetical protein
MTTHQPAANTAAVVTLTGVSGQRHVITQIDYSYSGTVTAGSLTVTNCVDQTGAAASYVVAVALTAGPIQLLFPEYLIGVEGAGMVVTLATGGAGATGTLNVVHAK